MAIQRIQRIQRIFCIFASAHPFFHAEKASVETEYGISIGRERGGLVEWSGMETPWGCRAEQKMYY